MLMKLVYDLSVYLIACYCKTKFTRCYFFY